MFIWMTPVKKAALITMVTQVQLQEHDETKGTENTGII